MLLYNMHNQQPYSYRALAWRNIIYFGFLTIVTVVVLPVYAYFFDFKPIAWILFGVMAVCTMLATTFGYHRLFSHRAYKAHPIVVFLNLFFGAASFGGSALRWSALHRDHHRYTDGDQDPYNIKKGFWYAHMDLILRYRHNVCLDQVKDLSANPMIRHQREH